MNFREAFSIVCLRILLYGWKRRKAFQQGLQPTLQDMATCTCCLWIRDLSKPALFWLPMSWGIQPALLQIICRIGMTCHCWAICWAWRALQLELAGLDFPHVWECLQPRTLFEMKMLTLRWCDMVMDCAMKGLCWCCGTEVSKSRQHVSRG